MRWAEVHAKLLSQSNNLQALTRSQVEAANAIVGALGAGIQYLNLWGDAGVGKTFLARYLTHYHHGVYLSAYPNTLPASPLGTWGCVDNVPSVQVDARAIYGALIFRRATAVLLITQKPIRDSIFSVPLFLTTSDYQAVYATLARLYPSIHLPDSRGAQSSLWALVRDSTTTLPNQHSA